MLAVTSPLLESDKLALVPVITSVKEVAMLPSASGNVPFTDNTLAVNCIPLTVIPLPIIGT